MQHWPGTWRIHIAGLNLGKLQHYGGRWPNQSRRLKKSSVTADVGATAPRAKQRTDPSMPLNKLRELGVHELNVLCLNPSCGHEITFNADDYGAETELSWFRPRMICARCGNRRLDVQPNF